VLGEEASIRKSAAYSPRISRFLAEPGRFLVATAATAVARIIGKAFRDGKTCYYVDDSVYHTFSGIVFDHCQYRMRAFKKGETEICTVFGQTCDGMDAIVQSENCPGSRSTICSTRKTSAPTATPPRRTSTASSRRRWCM